MLRTIIEYVLIYSFCIILICICFYLSCVFFWGFSKCSALSEACLKNRESVVRLLIDARADVNRVDNDGVSFFEFCY